MLDSTIAKCLSTSRLKPVLVHTPTPRHSVLRKPQRSASDRIENRQHCRLSNRLGLKAKDELATKLAEPRTVDTARLSNDTKHLDREAAELRTWRRCLDGLDRGNDCQSCVLQRMPASRQSKTLCADRSDL